MEEEWRREEGEEKVEERVKRGEEIATFSGFSVDF